MEAAFGPVFVGVAAVVLSHPSGGTRLRLLIRGGKGDRSWMGPGMPWGAIGDEAGLGQRLASEAAFFIVLRVIEELL